MGLPDLLPRRRERTVTLPELLGTDRRRAVEAASVGATAPVAAVYEAVLGELAPLCGNARAPRVEQHTKSHLLTVREAAVLLHVTTRWIYRHANSLPFIRRLSPRTLRCDPDGLERWCSKRAA